ncbi:MAG: phosphoribosylformylglycinamidine cyclo-ligase [Nitrospinae bacterium]|nr:phosphoribosylformylglycinamidine cyclo-ligase [Nitrospinota bacterium]
MDDSVTYKTAGVDIDAGMESLRRIKKAAAATHNTSVLTGLGSFGSLFDMGATLKEFQEPVLVQSVDGVGTKLMVARMMGRYDTVGVDLVNHCCNDILCQGARGLTFLDYIAVDVLKPEQIEALVTGMAKACAANGVALVGGETAELPGVYAAGEYDLVGLITGVVDKSKIITGRDIKKGDVIIGLKSSGLHTNGYTLARKVLFDRMGFGVDSHHPELGTTVGEALLASHRDYSRPLLPVFEKRRVKGVAHITGGGLIDNVPRILPSNVDAVFKTSSWTVPALFRLIAQGGAVPKDDMYRSTNMGVGIILVVSPEEASAVAGDLKDAGEEPMFIGEIAEGSGATRLE